MSAGGAGGGPAVSPPPPQNGEGGRPPRRPALEGRPGEAGSAAPPLGPARGHPAPPCAAGGLPLCGRRPVPERGRPSARGGGRCPLLPAGAYTAGGRGPACGWGRGAPGWHAAGAGVRQPGGRLLPRSRVHLRRGQQRAARGRRRLIPPHPRSRCAPPSALFLPAIYPLVVTGHGCGSVVSLGCAGVCAVCFL